MAKIDLELAVIVGVMAIIFTSLLIILHLPRHGFELLLGRKCLYAKINEQGIRFPEVRVRN